MWDLSGGCCHIFLHSVANFVIVWQEHAQDRQADVVGSSRPVPVDGE